MIIQAYLCSLLILSVTSISSNFDLQSIDSLVPAKSILHIIGDFTIEHEKSWETRLLKFLVRSQNFIKVLVNLPSSHSILFNQYYGSSYKNEFVFSNYFGHSTSSFNFIFLHKLETDFEKNEFVQTRDSFSYCGENPIYIFLVLSVINTKTFILSSDAAETSKLFGIPDHPTETEALQIFVVCLPCYLYSLIELKASISEYSTILDSSWKMQNSDLQGMH